MERNRAVWLVKGGEEDEEAAAEDEAEAEAEAEEEEQEKEQEEEEEEQQQQQQQQAEEDTRRCSRLTPPPAAAPAAHATTSTPAGNATIVGTTAPRVWPCAAAAPQCEQLEGKRGGDLSTQHATVGRQCERCECFNACGPCQAIGAVTIDGSL